THHAAALLSDAAGAEIRVIDGSLTVSASQHLPRLQIGSGQDALVTLTPGANKVLVTPALAFDSNGVNRLDVSDNKLIILGAGDVAGVTNWIRTGRGDGTWNGSGIVTTQSAAIGSNYTSLGVALASDVRPITATATDLWAGQTVSGSDVLVMYT